MANPLPCKICETNGDATVADWLITAQSEGSGFPPGATFYVCRPCLTGLLVAQLQEDAEANPITPTVAAEDPGYPDYYPDGYPPDGPYIPGGEPGILAAIEADEGKVTPAARNGRSSKSKAPPEPAAEQTSEPETAAADVHE